MATYGAYPIDDGGGSPTQVWQQVIATLRDVVDTGGHEPAGILIRSMRVSKLFARTLREDPAEADVPSHRLLLRAAFIRKVAAGIYTTMPLGLRTMNKIERVVREEMDASGAQELRMPIVLHAEPWKLTGRWEAYGDLMFRLQDRHGRQFVLGPTQEEIAAPLVQQEFPSYRDLPVNIYQVEWKYRDEFRPRYGLLRGREFLMKDAYTFDRDEEGMRESYRVMYEAYQRVFDRLGLDHVIVEADPGTIGGGINHEFMALADVGEDLFVRCENGDYLADTEAATPRAPEPAADDDPRPLTEVETPGAVTIDLMVEQMGVPAEATMKCIMFDVEGRTVAVLVPGDREVGEEKLARLHFPERVRRFEDEDFTRTGFAKGFVGPQGFGPEVDDLRGPLGPWTAELGHRRESTGRPRHRSHPRSRLPRRSLGGPGPDPRRGPLSDRRRSAGDRAVDRRRSHLSAGDVLLGALGGDIPGRGRVTSVTT